MTKRTNQTSIPTPDTGVKYLHEILNHKDFYPKNMDFRETLYGSQS